ncbi:formin-like protein 2-like [Scleropages formosus]|uniref:Formin-like protein 2-like n=1 Tax=Scleropages formosus TaxID=113540 RepID=A0A0P7YEL6_SCLFO|nr:formin-like protein 2-like [Scleropages formosus]
MKNSMNLPPDKARLLRQYDNEKKWELICDQERFQVKNPPHTYIQKVRGYLDPAVTRKTLRRRVQESTQVLRELEISLRTNHIGWVREFLNEENKGLDVLVEYLSFAQCAVTFDTENPEATTENSVDKSKPWNTSIEDLNGGTTIPGSVGGGNLSRPGRHLTFRSNNVPNRRTLKNSRLVSKKDDVHVCIITKALVLELLAAVCLVRGGHEIILSAFDNFKEVPMGSCSENMSCRAMAALNEFMMNILCRFCEISSLCWCLNSSLTAFLFKACGESQRFEKLMEYFKNEDNNIDFMVACMQFINIVVHSVEDMNFRVHLQYDFTKLCLDEYLEKLKHTESDKLQVQIQAYLDNVFDVGSLLEDAEMKNAALERVEELEETISHMTEKLQDMENEAMAKIVELEKQLMQRNKELESIREVYKDASSQVHSLRKMVKEKDEAIQRQCNLERKIQELEKQGTIKIQEKGDGDVAILPSAVRGAALSTSTESVGDAHLGRVVSALGPPNGTIPGGVSPPPPPPPPLPTVAGSAVKIKKPIKTKFRMPVFNWVALKPNQINGTVFNEIDDERILEDLNVEEFEEMFKTKAQGSAVDVISTKQRVSQKASNKVTLLDANRAKNLAITLRKVGKTPEEICKAIQMFDLQTLPVDFVECLMRFIPTEKEVKVLRQYEKERKPLESLTEEDRFMMHFSKIERLMQKMTIMAFMANFCESVQMLTPQIHAIIAASVSIKSSQKLKKILEIILALGNYMNSGKRGAVYGFKLQSLDLLLETKSTDRKQTLLHYIANIVKEKYPSVSLFYNELNYVEKAAAVSLENVLLDVKELQRGMDLSRREYSIHGHNVLLKDFIALNEGRLKQLQDDAKVAQDAFEDAVKFYGESSKTTPPSVFFPVFVRFIKSYKQAEEDNEQRRRQEQMLMERLLEQEAMMQEENQKSPSQKTKRQQQELIAELRRKQVKDSRHVYEGKDGAIEDIITGTPPAAPQRCWM